MLLRQSTALQALDNRGNVWFNTLMNITTYTGVRCFYVTARLGTGVNSYLMPADSEAEAIARFCNFLCKRFGMRWAKAKYHAELR